MIFDAGADDNGGEVDIITRSGGNAPLFAVGFALCQPAQTSDDDRTIIVEVDPGVAASNIGIESGLFAVRSIEFPPSDGAGRYLEHPHLMS